MGLFFCEEQDPRITLTVKEAVLSIVGFGALLSRICCTGIADRFGRRAAIFSADVLIVSSIALQSKTRSTVAFFIARFLVGMGMGLSFVVTPTYLCEIAPRKRRGLFICLNEVAVCIGCLLGLHISSRENTDWAWQWQNVVRVAAIPAGLQLIFILALPESPRWYALQGKMDALDNSIRSLGLQSETLELRNLAFKVESAEGVEGIPHANHTSCRSRYFEGWRFYKRQCVISLGLASFTASIGSLAVQAYAYDLLKVCQVQEPTAILPSIGWMKLAGALLAMFASDFEMLGRRRLIIGGSLLCTLCDLTLAIHLAFPNQFPGVLPATCVILRIFAWTAGYGGLQFLVISELLPNPVRSSIMGQCQAVASIIDIFIFQIFESMLFANAVATFSIFGAINFFSCLFAAAFLPDMRGLALETVSCQGSGPRAYDALDEDKRSLELEPTIVGAQQPD